MTKTEIKQVLVKQPGKGKPVNPYSPMDGMTAIDPRSKFWKFAENNPERPAIDINGHDSQPREQPYECKEVWRAWVQSRSGMSWMILEPFLDVEPQVSVETLLEDCKSQNIKTELAYQSIEDAVKGEKEPLKEGDTVEFEYYTDTSVKTGSGVIVWANDKDCVVNDTKGKRHQMEISAVSKILNNQKPKAITEQDRDWFNDTKEAEQFLIEHDWRKNEDIPFYKVAILLNRFRGLKPLHSTPVNETTHQIVCHDTTNLNISVNEAKEVESVEQAYYSEKDVVDIIEAVKDECAKKQSIHCDLEFDPSCSNKWHVKTEDKRDAIFTPSDHLIKIIDPKKILKAYRATHPIENKEGVKSAEEILRNCDRMYGSFHCTYKFESIVDAMKIYAAQFTPIEQGKRMVSVDEVEKLIGGQHEVNCQWLLNKISQ